MSASVTSVLLTPVSCISTGFPVVAAHSIM